MKFGGLLEEGWYYLISEFGTIQSMYLHLVTYCPTFDQLVNFMNQMFSDAVHFSHTFQNSLDLVQLACTYA